MVEPLTLFILTIMKVGGTNVDGLYLTMVKQTEHMIRRLEFGLFGYVVDQSDLFYIGSTQSDLLVH